MRITVNDPMAALRADRAERVNRNFSTIAADRLHLDSAHAQKRVWAASQDDRLKPEADLRGITVAELAAQIMAKPDHAAARELSRQKIMMRIDAARTPEELQAI
jgi:hypothetical protein